VNHKRVYRLYQKEGLSLRKKRPRRHASAAQRMERIEAGAANECWSMDFVSDALYDGRRLRALTIVDNYTRECLAIEVDQGIGGEKVAGVLGRITMKRSTPKTIRVDNGPEFVSKVLDQWAYRNGVTLDFSRPGKPTDNAYVESFNGSLRDECLNVNWFLSLQDARGKIEVGGGTTMRVDLTQRSETCRPANSPARAGLAPPLLVLQHSDFSLPSWT
jgi:putative transposase